MMSSRISNTHKIIERPKTYNGSKGEKKRRFAKMGQDVEMKESRKVREGREDDIVRWSRREGRTIHCFIDIRERLE